MGNMILVIHIHSLHHVQIFIHKFKSKNTSNNYLNNKMDK